MAESELWWDHSPGWCFKWNSDLSNHHPPDPLNHRMQPFERMIDRFRLILLGDQGLESEY
jgi:hypothetical protein